MNSVSKQINGSLIAGIKDIIIIIIVYGGFRTLFYAFPKLKTLFFIRPVGFLVSLFQGDGVYTGCEWVFKSGNMNIILSELCSGTTFFCLITAYFIAKHRNGGISGWWVVVCYPLSLPVNAARVLSSMYIYEYTANLFSRQANDMIHLFVGVAVFLTVFLTLTLFLDRKIAEKYYDRKSI